MDIPQHRSDVRKIHQCTTKTQMEKMTSKLGCCYSILLELPYFLPIEMVLIDPMHNLFLGTAKHSARDLWIGRNIIKDSDLTQVEEKLKRAIVPSGLGHLPVSIKHGVFLTAEQWKSWTL